MKNTRRLLPLALLLLAASAPAKKIYKYTDAKGITHYTDVKPAQDQGQVTETVVRSTEHRNIAELRVDGTDQERQALAFNQLAGPVQIAIRFDANDNVAADPPLPLAVVLGANEERVLARMRPRDGSQGGTFTLAFEAVPGDPAARASDVEYRVPLAGGYRIDQGFNGAFSHTDEQSRYAVDMAVDEGTPVLAARDGVVMQVEDDFAGHGLDKEKYATRANVVRVLHTDGSMAIYAHLRPDSVKVRPGQHAYLGQVLGESGNTGYSTGPHLHFAVQVNAGLKLVSVPFRMVGPEGALHLTAAPAAAAGAAR